MSLTLSFIISAEFLEFLDQEEKNRVQLRELEAEVSRLNEQAARYQKEIKSLEMKLKNAKHMLDVEKAKRITTEKEKNDLVGNSSTFNRVRYLQDNYISINQIYSGAIHTPSCKLI